MVMVNVGSQGHDRRGSRRKWRQCRPWRRILTKRVGILEGLLDVSCSILLLMLVRFHLVLVALCPFGICIPHRFCQREAHQWDEEKEV